MAPEKKLAPRPVFKTTIRANAAAIICLHNHPSGNPEPSREDIRVTRRLMETQPITGLSRVDLAALLQ